MLRGLRGGPWQSMNQDLWLMLSAYFTYEYLYLMTCRDLSPRSAVPETTPWALQAKPMCLAEPSSSVY